MIDSLTRGPRSAVAPEITEFSVQKVSPGVALATYAVGASATRRSSLWRRDGESWRLVFHQGAPSDPA